MNLEEVLITSQRLKLIPISEKYTKDIFKTFTTEVTTYMYPKAAEDITETEVFVNRSVEQRNAGSDLVMAILDKNSEEFIGCVGLHGINTRVPEIGIWTKKSSHGNGYGLEAVSAAIEFARNNFDFDYLLYPVDKRNKASRRIPESHNGVIKDEKILVAQHGNELQIVDYWIY